MQAIGRIIDNTKIVLAGLGLLNSGGIAGDRFSMKNYSRVAVVIGLAPASGTDPSAVTLKQSKSVDNSPVTEKALAFSKMYKNGAPGTSDTLVETAVTSDTFSTSALAALELYVIEVDEQDLDIDNGFDCIRVDMTDPGSVSTPAFALYIGYEGKYLGGVDRTPSAITD